MPADVGTQTVSLKYLDAVRSGLVNLRHYKTRPTGIYEGGEVSTSIPSNTVTIGPLICEISDGTYQVRVQTADSVNVALDSTNKYLVLRWEYTGNASDDYMDLLATSSVAANDILLGEMTYSGATPVSFSQASRSIPEHYKYQLKVTPTYVNSSRVVVNPGVAAVASGIVAVPWQYVDLSGYTAGQSIYIYISDTGAVAHSATATTYNAKAILAIIVLPVGKIITKSDITDGRSLVHKPVFPDESTITTNTSTGKIAVASSIQWPGFGTRTTTDSLGNTLTQNSVYQAQCDGYLIAATTSATTYLLLYSDSSNPPVTFLGGFYEAGGYAKATGAASGLIKNGDYIKITQNSSSLVIYWMPFGTGDLVKQ
jgi:hypothetical protein